MSFLVAVLLLLLRKINGIRQLIQHDVWVLRRLAWFERRSNWPAGWRLVAWLALMVLPVAAFWLALWPVAYGWLRLPIELLVLLWAIGRNNARDSDFPQSKNNPPAYERRWQKVLLWQRYAGLFAVLFWYALLGPVPALLYRLLALASKQSADKGIRNAACGGRQILDWLPARAFVLTLGMAGNLLTAGRVLWPRLFDVSASPRRLVVEGGRAAAGFSETASANLCLRSGQGVRLLNYLLNQALLIWMSVWALVVLLV